MAWTKEQKRAAQRRDRVLVDIHMSLNAIPEPIGPEAAKALDGLGEIHFKGHLSPEGAKRIYKMLEEELRLAAATAPIERLLG